MDLGQAAQPAGNLYERLSYRCGYVFKLKRDARISKDGNSRSQLSLSDYLGLARSRIKNVLCALASADCASIDTKPELR